MAGLDSYVKLLLHCNGSDGSTTFIDSSSYGKTVTPVGDAQIDTSQYKFGGASALFDNTGDYLSITDSEDWDLGNGDFTIDCWVRLADTGNNTICGRVTDGNSYFYFTFESTVLRFRDWVGSNNVDIQRSVSISTNTWYHVAITRSGNDFRIFLDGVQQGATVTSSATMTARSVALDVGHMTENAGYAFNGWIDEFRFSKGIARWTENFTPPTEEYSVAENRFDFSESVLINDSNSFIDPVFRFLEELNINDTSLLKPTYFPFSESVLINEVKSFIDPVLRFSEAVNVNDSTILSELNFASNGTRILSYNPLLFVTNTDTAKIVKVDTTDPQNLTWQIETLGVSYALDASINFNTGYIYVTGDSGKIAKIEINDISNQTIIDVSDSDDFETIDTLSDFGISFAGTESEIGELYLIDERESVGFESRIDVLATYGLPFESNISAIQARNFESRMDVLATQSSGFGSSIVCLEDNTNLITPIKLTDFSVYLDGVELSNTDITLDSIVITHSITSKSQASFKLNRLHDKIDYDLSGNYKEISNQNEVEIYIDGNLEFEGRISSILCEYDVNLEYIQVSALGDIKGHSFESKTIPLASKNEKLSLYNVLVQNPTILNPYVDPEDLRPEKYKGVFINLGRREEQNIKRFISLALQQNADKITDGSFIYLQNWQYFWGPITAIKPGFFATVDLTPGGSGFQMPSSFFGTAPSLGTSAKIFNYIGTSLNPVSDDIWQLYSAGYKYQREYENKITRLGEGKLYLSQLESVLPNYNFTSVFSSLQSSGYLSGNTLTNSAKTIFSSDDLNIPYSKTVKNIVYNLIDNAFGYYVGEAPYKEVGAKNGILIPKWRWEDRDNGLYSVLDESYNYEKFCKEVADLEYELLKNINGDILPDTSCTIRCTVDAYYFYKINLLNRVNIDNTTQKDIFNGQNGFPVSVKMITINASDRQVSISTDNRMSDLEQEEIRKNFPDENDPKYLYKGQEAFLSPKVDMNTLLEVE